MVLHSGSESRRRRVVTNLTLALASTPLVAALVVACTAFSGPRSNPRSSDDDGGENAATPVVGGDGSVGNEDGGSPPPSTTSCNERSLSFDGTGKFATVPDSPDLDLLNTDFTVEAWINPETMSEGHIASHHDHNTNVGWAFLVKNRNVELRLYGINTATMNGYNRTAGNNGGIYVIDGNWAHVAGVRQGNKISVYYKGNLVGDTTNLTELDQRPFSGPLSIGRFAARAVGQNNDFPFRGLIDEIRISKTARYTQGFTPSRQRFTPDSMTIALYHADEANGSMLLTDATGTNTGAFWVDAGPKRADTPCLADR